MQAARAAIEQEEEEEALLAFLQSSAQREGFRRKLLPLMMRVALWPFLFLSYPYVKGKRHFIRLNTWI